MRNRSPKLSSDNQWSPNSNKSHSAPEGTGRDARINIDTSQKSNTIMSPLQLSPSGNSHNQRAMSPLLPSLPKSHVKALPSSPTDQSIGSVGSKASKSSLTSKSKRVKMKHHSASVDALLITKKLGLYDIDNSTGEVTSVFNPHNKVVPNV
jgi:hypothetical protein